MLSALPLGLDANAVSAEESLQAPPRQQLACGAIDVAMMMHLSGPLLKRSANALMGWQLRWFEVGGGSVRYYSSPDEAKAHAKPAGKVSLAGLCVQRKSNSAFDFTVLQTGDTIFSLDADVGSEVGSAGWELEPAGVQLFNTELRRPLQRPRRRRSNRQGWQKKPRQRRRQSSKLRLQRRLRQRRRHSDEQKWQWTPRSRKR